MPVTPGSPKSRSTPDGKEHAECEGRGVVNGVSPRPRPTPMGGVRERHERGHWLRAQQSAGAPSAGLSLGAPGTHHRLRNSIPVSTRLDQGVAANPDAPMPQPFAPPLRELPRTRTRTPGGQAASVLEAVKKNSFSRLTSRPALVSNCSASASAYASVSPKFVAFANRMIGRSAVPSSWRRSVFSSG